MAQIRSISTTLILLVITAGFACHPAEHHSRLDLTQIDFIGEATFPTGHRFAGAELGGLSGISYDEAQQRYYAISDDNGRFAPARFYTLRIDLSDGQLQPGDIVFVRLDTLLDVDGKPFVRATIDAEGIAMFEDNSVYVSSEGGLKFSAPPFIRRFATNGRFIESLQLPAKILPDPAGKSGVRRNTSLESLTITPDHKFLFSALENALLQDGPRAGPNVRSPSRIIKYDLQSREAVAEYCYWVEAVPLRPPSDSARTDNGLVELVALDETRLLAMERAYVAGVGNAIRIFEISLGGADNIQNIDTLDAEAVRPVAKTLRLSLGPAERRVDNIEGMCLGPLLPDGRQSLILVSDNNFNHHGQVTQFLAFAIGMHPERASAHSISEIQGDGHHSSLQDSLVTDVPGIVTAVMASRRRKGFWLQAPEDDGNPATSEGIFVSTGKSVPQVRVGDRVLVSGTVQEAGFRRQLTVTQIEGESVTITSAGNALPAPVIIGEAGFMPPNDIVDDDSLTTFDPDHDGIDFYERFEGMRVQVRDPVVAGPTSRFGEFVVLADGGRHASVRSKRGGIVLREHDPNPERILVSGALLKKTPRVNVGDTFPGALTGVMDYSFSNYKLLVTEGFPEAGKGGLVPEVTELHSGEHQLTVASYNVENLDFLDSETKYQKVARSITINLAAPDIVGLQEVQDDDGPGNKGVTSARKTFRRLIREIELAGGPRYAFCQVDPVNNADGGQPGGNIRVGFLYNPQRVQFHGRNQAADSTVIAMRAGQVSLTSNPGRVVFRQSAFKRSRKPLAAEFAFRGEKIFIINNHLNSKGGDDRLFGNAQPPVFKSEVKRGKQAQLVHDFVQRLLARDPDANVIVLGDMNEHEFRQPMQILAGTILTDLIFDIDIQDRYTYIFNGNSQVLDHIFVSEHLRTVGAPELDIVHINAEFLRDQHASDHDPLLARFTIASNQR